MKVFTSLWNGSNEVAFQCLPLHILFTIMKKDCMDAAPFNIFEVLSLPFYYKAIITIIFNNMRQEQKFMHVPHCKTRPHFEFFFLKPWIRLHLSFLPMWTRMNKALIWGTQALSFQGVCLHLIKSTSFAKSYMDTKLLF